MDNSVYESLISGVADRGFGVFESFLDSKLLNGLRNNLLRKLAAGEMHLAGVGKKHSFVKDIKVRGDLIGWLDPDRVDSNEEMLLKWMDRFIVYLNQTCFTNLKRYEFHYAYYEAGSFYKKHLDQFRSDSTRKFSFVCYLNPEWEEADGGQLVLYTKGGEVSVLPKIGTVCFFKSDEIEHEVKPAGKPRMSVTGWLKG